MSIYSSLNVGITALQAQSNKINLISQNLANSATVGYKSGSTNFSDLIVDNSATNYTPGGVESSIDMVNTAQGDLAPSDSPTDIAIGGSGFFAVSASPTGTANYFTRAGSFSPDADGNYVNTAGYFLQGWPVDSTGKVTQTLQTVNVAQVTDPPIATTTAAFQLNLNALETAYTAPPVYNAASNTANMASGSIPPQTTSTATITDSLGTQHTVTTGFLKTSATTWAVEMYVHPASDITGSSSGQINAGTITFNPDGTLNNLSSSLTSPVTINWSDGATASTTAFNQTLVSTLPSTQADYSPPYNAADPTANMASGSVAPQFNTPVNVIDSLGVSHVLTAGFLKTGTNSWAVEVYAQPASDVTGAASGQVAAGTITFNADGSLATISPSLTQPIAINWSNAGTSPSAITVNWGTAGPIFGTPGATIVGRTDGLEQLATPYNRINVTQNGQVGGTLTSTTISQNGFVQATFSNGDKRNLFQIPLAQFIDPDQLSTNSGDVFTATVASGAANFLAPGQSGAGDIDSGELESSNVDVAAQLTDIVTAQQAYQANTKLITATDQMMQTLTQMVV